MESAAPDAPLAPPVVAVVVVHDPGPWFDESLAALAAQDYPNLNTLFLLTTGVNAASDAEVRRRIFARLPEAFVRELGTNPGFGAAANEVLRLVEGDSGFFCFCHDDVALDADAIRMLVEELYRSNAGVVGPKLVSWDDPGLLQTVGLGLDRFGEIDSIIEPGEYDQEQHDRVRDVFVLPSACLLVRADLFRALGGFDPAISFHGDDVDLCWRVHLSGARVVVAPQARARHREELEVRRPELHHDLLRSRHRVRSVMTLTGSSRLPLRSLEMVVLTVAELVVGAFTGRLGEAWSSVRAMIGLIPRLPAVLSRRGAIAKIRQVGDAEVLPLQERGSARLTSFRRSRDTATYIGVETNVRRWRESTLAVTATWLLLLAAIIVASRTLIDTAVPAIGELLPMPASARDLAGDYASAWNPGGLGGTVANPTGWAVLSVASVFWLFKMGAGLTILLIGLVVLGAWGMWRLATVFPTNRARITALLVYAAVPLLPGVISTGRLSALVGYAAVPWFVNLLRTAAGIGTADPAAAAVDLADGVIVLSARERIRRAAARSHRRRAGHRAGPERRRRAGRHRRRTRRDDPAGRRRMAHGGMADRARRRRAARRSRPQPAVGVDLVVGRPRSRAAGRTARPGGAGHRNDGGRPVPVRGAGAGPLPPGPRRAGPLAGLAVDVGGAGGRTDRRVPRPGRAAGP